jgi:MEDS: MEthanogen/methylotroph, DcmR Sensory domain
MSGAPYDFPSLKPGGHVCLPYVGDEEKHEAIAGFFHDGVLRGERCLYWGSVAGFAALLSCLEHRNVSAAVLRDRGAIVFADSKQGLPPRFDAQTQATTIRAASASARSEGYAGLRVASAPDLGTREAIDRDRLASLEHSLSRLYDDQHVTGLCAFDQRAPNGMPLDVALATHELAIIAGRLCSNPYFNSTSSGQHSPGGTARTAWMTENILETASTHELLEAESAALIVENSRSAKRDADYRRQIAALSRAVEARDRLIITAARWLSRPMPAMCSHLQDLAKDQRFQQCQTELETCDEHLAAMTRLSHGLDEIASFLQMQVVLRPEKLDLVEVARAAISEIEDDRTADQVEVALDGAARIMGTWDRLRLTRLFYSLIRTAREQGYNTGVRLRLDDLLQFARVRIEFMLPHAPALSDSGERVRTLAYGPSGESDYERLAVQLWPAREIVRMMGGTLGISTWADARVIFTLDLPKASPPLPVEDKPSSLHSEDRLSRQ